MRRWPGSRRAFTLVEGLVALVIGMMILSMSGAMLWRTRVWFSRLEDRLDPRESAHLALARMRQSLEDAWAYTISNQGERIQFFLPDRDGEVRFTRLAGKLQMRALGETAFRDLIPHGVTQFRVRSIRTGLLLVAIELARPTRPGRLQALDSMRFIDEVFLPAVGQRDSDLPWARFLEPVRAGVSNGDDR